ncbi:hypothetical protein NEOKW01_1210 [Nematocida sp. AWRm80]|nr:hypothetical protein NEOKW01_1210 [Nematocida sp. AWRm80]
MHSGKRWNNLGERLEKKRGSEKKVLQGPCIKKPKIILCIQNATEETEGTSNSIPSKKKDALSILELERKVPLEEHIYLLNKRVTVHNTSLCLLDVLDIRNTFLWIETFQEKVLKNSWDESMAINAFRIAVSKDIQRRVIKEANTVIECIRCLNKWIYTPENILELYSEIVRLKSANFSSLHEYYYELRILIRAYAKYIQMTENEILSCIRKQFWEGLSLSIKQILNGNISEKDTPLEIITKIDQFKKDMLLKEGIPQIISNTNSISRGLKVFPRYIPVPEKQKEFVPSEIDEEDDSSQSKISSGYISCNQMVSTFSTILATAEAVERVQDTLLPYLYKTETKKPIKNPFRQKYSEETFPRVSLPRKVFTSSNFRENLVHAIIHQNKFKPNTIFKEYTQGKLFVIDATYLNTTIGALLYQNAQPISFFHTDIFGEQLQYTSTEKEILALHLAQIHFKSIIQGSPVRLISNTYKSFSYCLGGHSYIDEVPVLEE